MKSVSKNKAPRRPQQPTQLPRTEIPSSSVYGFLVLSNQFQSLQDSELAVSTSQSQISDRLIDPRKTRLARLQAARGTVEQGTSGNLSNEGIFQTVPPMRDAQGILNNGDGVEPVASGISHSFFPDSLSISPLDILTLQSGGIVQNLLETGAIFDDAMYSNAVNEVDCTIESCNKRISYVGQEWSAGRPGNRPIGARTAARNSDMCLGPYATRIVQSPHTGCNTHEIEASSRRLPRKEDQNITSQLRASTSGRSPAAEDRASPATVALHLCRPPYFTGGADDDVHVWASIVDRWLRTVQGEPSTQLTYVVSLLRGAAIEWYSSMETRTGCPGDWTTLRNAMLERFGSSIRAGKARAALLQMTQDKMTVLEYFDAFESYLAQIEDYDESFYLAKFIFGL